jgi:hypothetical protein
MLKDICIENIKPEKIKDTLDFIDKNEFATTGDNYINNFISKKNQFFSKSVSKKLKIVNVEINFRLFCDYWKCKKSRRLEENYQGIMASLYFKNKYIENFLEDIIVKNTNKRNILYITIDFMDYGLDDDIKDNEYVAHCGVLIMLPNRGKYQAYYINSHGLDLLDYTTYEYKLGIHKKREIQYEKPVDVMFVSTYLNFINKKFKTGIAYDTTEKHNYYGTDLQIGDHHGVCFIFPYIIWYYFGKYYNTKRYYYPNEERIVIKSCREMLLKGNLTECIESFILGFNKKYDIAYLKNLTRKKKTKKLNKILEKSGTIFIKKLLGVFIPFFSQGLKL